MAPAYPPALGLELLPPVPRVELLPPVPRVELLPPVPPPREQGGGDVRCEACELSHAPPALPGEAGGRGGGVLAACATAARFEGEGAGRGRSSHEVRPEDDD